MAKGFQGMPGNMGGLMKQAQKMQQQLQKVQEEAKTLTAESSTGGGVVRAVCNGENRVVSLTIDPQVVDPSDVGMLQDLILGAVNQALEQVQDSVKQEMAKVTGGMSLPGLF